MSVIKHFDMTEAGQKIRVWMFWDTTNTNARHIGTRELIGPNGPVSDDTPGYDINGRPFGPDGPDISVGHNLAGDANAVGDNIVGPRLAEAGGNTEGEA